MKTMIIATGIAFASLFFTGFQGGDNTPEILRNKAIPQEKKDVLKKIVGRWITQTNIHAWKGQPASKVIGSDIWQWSPDGNFLLHMGYGIREKGGFGAMEITGYDAKTGQFDSYNFNPDGSFSMFTLSVHGNVWIWDSKDVRTTGTMDEDGRLLKVKHEYTSDGKTYEEFMDGFLTKGSDN